MKKWMIAAIVLLVLVVIAGYVFIPAAIKVTTAVKVKCTAVGARRVLANKNKWNQWWHVTDTSGKFINKDVYYEPGRNYYNNFEIIITSDSKKFSSSLNVLPVREDSILLFWQYEFDTTFNFFKRITNYIHAHELAINMDEVLQNLQTFLSKNENIYNMVIRREIVKDTLLIVQKKTFAHNPTLKEIYEMLDEMKAYAKVHGAKETGYPMLNMEILDTTNFDAMVALPVDKELAPNNSIVIKRMVPGKILVAEVKGGKGSIKQGFSQLQNYFVDNNLQSPAIPFQSLINNRLETDSADWITKLYYPIY